MWSVCLVLHESQAAEAWKNASDEAKAAHIAAAEQEKEQYEQALQEYNKSSLKDIEDAEAVTAGVASQDKAAQPQVQLPLPETDLMSSSDCSLSLCCISQAHCCLCYAVLN